MSVLTEFAGADRKNPFFGSLGSNHHNKYNDKFNPTDLRESNVSRSQSITDRKFASQDFNFNRNSNNVETNTNNTNPNMYSTNPFSTQNSKSFSS